jgi:Putative zinc-finger
MSTTPTSCSYEMWDGAYVIGSLSPADRREFEAHLDGCAACSRAVRDLAGLPGLLGRIGPDVFEDGDAEPVPDTLRPRLARAVRRQQRRRTWLTAGVAAAAAAAVTVGGVVAFDHSSETPTAQGHPVTTSIFRPMTQVAHDSMTASVALTPVPWGTRLDLTCSYPHSAFSYEGGAYALVVHTADGHAQRVATWNGLPGRSMRVSGATAARSQDITSVEVTHLDGSPVLELAL